MAKDLSRYIDEVRLEVADEDRDLRLDHFLVGKIFWRSRRDLQDRIKAGLVLVGERPAKPATRLKVGDTVVVKVTADDLPDQKPEDIELNILFENDEVVVLNKQAGVLVHPTGRHVYDTLMNALHLRFREEESSLEPHVVHRLDRNTSGVLIVAKTQNAKRELQEIFQNRHPRKEYLALAEGIATEDSGEITASIGPDDHAEIRLKMCVREDGAPCRSVYQVEERFESHTLFRVRIETGRQHQIRVHLAHIGHPVVADPLYGDPMSLGRIGEEPLIERQALHAALLEIAVPGCEGHSILESPLPDDIVSVIQALRAGESLVPLRDVQSARWRRA